MFSGAGKTIFGRLDTGMLEVFASFMDLCLFPFFSPFAVLRLPFMQFIHNDGSFAIHQCANVPSYVMNDTWRLGVM